MSDRVLIPLPGVGTLELPRDVYERCLRPIAAPAAQAPAAPQKAGSELLDAKGVAAALSLPVSWIREKARQRAIPSEKAGRYVRFNLPAVRKALAAAGDHSSFGRA
jgi:hypothetical protein